MFNENKNPVTEEVTENVEELATEELVDGAKVEEPTVEAPVETFTKEQVDEMIAKKLARREAKIRKDYEKKYGKLENVLKAGTGEEDIDSIADTFEDFYTKRGIEIPQTSQYSQRDIEYLADRDANEIIEQGYDEIADELNRLSEIGFDNMDSTDKYIFMKLKKEADRLTNEKELKSIGVTELPDDFKDFAEKLNPNLSIKEKYEMYTKINPKAKGTKIGSMKNNTITDGGVKEFYTYEEAVKFTKEDYDKNPALFKAVENSMTKW